MNIQHLKERLLKLEADLSAQVERHLKSGAEQTRDTSARDSGDSSVADQAASEEFTEAEVDSTVLQQVRDALQRMDNHVYGKCLVDGQPIEAKRLEALPWTPFCLKHQNLLESASRRQYPTL